MRSFAQLNLKPIRHAIVILDIDGTLVQDRLSLLDKATLRAISTLKSQHNSVYLVSNRKDHARNQSIADLAGIFYIKTPLRKPNPKIVSSIAPNNHKKRIVIGDKWITDGWFARRIGAQFIKVKRLESFRDHPLIFFINRFDDLLSRWLT